MEEDFCTVCPRGCPEGAAGRGFCGKAAGAVMEVAEIVAHRGEEPVLSGQRGICNVFFAHCNLQCIYCQNHTIAGRSVEERLVRHRGLEPVVEAIAGRLAETENMLGLVTATHYADQIPALMEALWARDLHPTVVYNSSGYERVETLQMLAPYVDIWLPDYKYSDSALAARYSHAADYPRRAQEALLEMFAQKGAGLPTDEGLAFRGMIVRHLVLPGQVENSIGCLQWLAENLSTRLHVSLMAQYCPPDVPTLPDALGRRLEAAEYERVVEAFYDLGFERGWVQELTAADNYKPHFGEQITFA